MKKRLLSMFIAVLTVTGIYALSIGDYVYTKNGRFKITGVNLITNGDFSSGTSGWTNDSYKSLNVDTFSVNSTGGPSNSPCLEILKTGGAGSGGSLYGSYPKESQKYYIFTYKVKATDGTTPSTSVTVDGSNYQDFYVNADGSHDKTAVGYAAIAKSKSYTSEWTTFVYDSLSQSDGFFVLNMYNLNVGDCFADFGLYEVSKVSDDRTLQVVIDEAEKYYNNSLLFPNDRENFLAIINEAKQYLTEDDISTVEGIISGLKEEIENFLDKNSVNVSSYFTNIDFNSSTVGSSVVSSIKGWTITGDRWFSRAAGGFFTTPYSERMYPYAYTLGKGGIQQTMELPAGKYMLSADIAAGKYENKNSNSYVEDFDYSGVKLFINNDSLECTGLTMDKLTKYTVYADVADGTPVTIGLYQTTTLGNRLQLDNFSIRCVGGDADNIANFVLQKQITAAKNALKIMIDSAQKVHDITEYYIFGKKILADSITLANTTYNTITDVATLTSQMNYVRSAISAYYSINKEYRNLIDDISECTSLVGEDKYSSGKTEFQSAIKTANEYITTVTEDNRDSLELVKQDSVLIVAKTTFYIANSNYSTPGLIELVNGDFSTAPSGTTLFGWTTDAISKYPWKRGATGTTGFDGDYFIYYWTGTSGKQNKYMWQDVTLPNAGLYEFSAQIIALNEKTTTNATTGVFLFTGRNEVKIDSVQIHSSIPTKFTVRAVVEAGTTLRVGLDARINQCANSIKIGNVQLKYYGDYAKYQADSISAAMIPARDSLQVEIDKAVALKNSVRNPRNVSTTVFETAISTAQYIKDNSQNLNEINEARPTLVAAEEAFKLTGVYPAEGTYFDITGCIKNAAFTDSLNYWSFDCDTASVSTDGISYYFSSTSSPSAKVSQTIENLPLGTYQMLCSGTYRIGLTTDFNIDAYKTSSPIYIYANNDSIAMRGLLEGVRDSANIVDSLGLSLYNYRHGNFTTQIDNGFFVNYLPFTLTKTTSAIVGVSINNIVTSSTYKIKEFKLRFWGDNITTEIKNIDTDSTMVNRNSNDINVYGVDGTVVRKNATSLDGLAKGLYIYKGKVYSVK